MRKKIKVPTKGTLADRIGPAAAEDFEKWLEMYAYKSKMLRKWAKEHGVPTVEVSVSEDDIGDVAMPIVKGE